MCTGAAHLNADEPRDTVPVAAPAPLTDVEGDGNQLPTSSTNESDFIDLFPELSDFRKRFTSNFVFMYNNINSYRHKHISIMELLNRGLVDYIAIAESKLSLDFPIAQFSSKNYEHYRQDFTLTSGGLLVHLREDIPQCRIPHAEINAHGFESICIEVTIGSTKTVITSIYKHPYVKNAYFKSCFSFIIDCLLKKYDDLIFLADANLCPKRSNTIKDICDTYGLTNLIKKPTCHKGRESTLLDIVLVSNPKRYSGTLNAKFYPSDFHNVVGGATRRFAPVKKPYHLKYRSYKKFDDTKFMNEMSCAPFHVAEIFDDVDDMAWFTSSLVSNVLDEHAPFKTKILKSKPVPYMNSELRKTMYAQNMARNKFIKFGQNHWESFRKLRNKAVALRKRSIKKYFMTRCEKPNREFWKTISPFISDKNSKTSNALSLNENGMVITDPSEIAEIFNDHFVNVAKEIGFQDSITSVNSAISKHSSHSSVLKIRERFKEAEKTFSFECVDSQTVMLCLKNLNPRKAIGYDCIPGKILKLACRELSSPITYIINSSILQNVFPSQIKYEKISPLF